jgi:predicted metalloprotease
MLIIVGIGVIGLVASLLADGLSMHELTRRSGDGFNDVGVGQEVSDSELRWTCQAAANPDDEAHCEAAALIDSIQALWEDQIGARHKPIPVVFFRGPVRSACQPAGHAGLPFYCHTDRTVYIDLDFYENLDSRLARGYVLAHEYAHSVQVGTQSGAQSTELQADCEAGAWASHATLLTTVTGQPLMQRITQDDINTALDAAGRIDDHDNLPPLEQITVGEPPNRHVVIVPRRHFSHGTAAQRDQALTMGLRAGLLDKCPKTGY